MVRFCASVAGLCNCLLSFEKSEEINYVRCLVLQKIELIKSIRQLDLKRSKLYESVNCKE